jgi:hypothetical protein
MNDPIYVPGGNPATFDPYRYMKMREDPKNAGGIPLQ